MNSIMQDPFGRKISYLRLSVTDRCDFRCTYCMAEKMQFLPRNEILTLEECLRVADSFVELGVEKIRITGGEPLVRKDVPWLIERLRKLHGLRELVMTSNGSQLELYAAPLAQAGLDRINISLDSLDRQTFRKITRNGDLGRVLAGIDSAVAVFGKGRVKLNTVLIRDENTQELPALLEFALERDVDISFIEQMPMGDTGHHHAFSYCSATEALVLLRQSYELVPSVESSGGPARYWRIPGRDSRVGFISPHSQNFCSSCNRMRITARGELFPCLGNEGMVDLLPAVRSGDAGLLRELILRAVAAKPLAHEFDITRPGSGIVRFMSRTGG